jgi:ATP-dependent helicase/nuclease subunit A
MPTKKDDTAVTAAARAAMQRDAVDEYRRLLYVALTRAADRLLVCGSVGRNKRPEGCWYDLVAGALLEHCQEEPADTGDGAVWRYRKGEAEADTPLVTSAPAVAASGVPDWLHRAARPEEPLPLPLSPSQAYDDATPPPRADAAARKAALARGVAVHRLLQSLPAIPPERRAEAARQFLARRSREFPAEQRAELAGKTLRLIEDPRLAALFAPGSRGEVPIVGHVTHGGVARPVAGVVDRLAVTADTVLIADYKTNREPPRTPADVPAPYIAQLALYRAVLMQLYPDKAMRAALVWTEVPDLMELSNDALDAALASLPTP